jgi:myo-inositol 2-dehydrogenase/D-chiro-inositol 1-dehydrogenase
MRVALFGCGRIGRVHAESVAEHPRAELAWVCDPMEAASG